MIPRQLLKKEFRFCLIRPKSKIPFERSWQRDNNYKFDDDRLLTHIKDGGNYGVLGGFSNLLIIDFDEEEIQNETEANLPTTFTVKTGGGLLHKYFFCDNRDSFKILDGNKDTLVDAQGIGKQVIGAGSTHPNGNKYVVVDESDIATITSSNLKAVFGKWLIKDKDIPDRKDLDKPTLTPILSRFGVDVTKNPTKCPWHNSKGGSCFSFDDSKGLWHCFHCDKGGDVISFVMENNSCDFKTACKEIDIKITPDIQQVEYKTELKDDEDIHTFILELLVDKKRNEASEHIAQIINNKYYIYTIRHDEKSEVWIYDQGIYIPQGRTFIREYCRKILKKAYTTPFTNEIISKIEADTYIESKEFFNANKVGEIAVLNGILNVLTKELLPFNPNKIYFNKLPVSYDDSKDCPNIKKFLNSTLKKGDVSIIKEVFGYCLYKDYFLEKAIMFNGGGRNGKSKTIELLKRFLGAENCTSIGLDKLSGDSFAAAELLNKLANLAGDISSKEIVDSSWFKGLTGRDYIGASRKFLPMVYFTNYAKMIFSANQLPITTDNSLAFWERWVLVDFPFTFINEEEYNKKSEEEKLKFKIKDPYIIENITTNDEMSGLLNWALIGLSNIIKNKDFTYSKSSSQVQLEWNRKSNSFSSFLIDCIEEDFNSKISKGELRRAYSKYCQEHKLRVFSDKLIRSTIYNSLPVMEDRYRDEGLQIAYWGGIKFKGGIESIDNFGFSIYTK